MALDLRQVFGAFTSPIRRNDRTRPQSASDRRHRRGILELDAAGRAGRGGNRLPREGPRDEQRPRDLAFRQQSTARPPSTSSSSSTGMATGEFHADWPPGRIDEAHRRPSRAGLGRYPRARRARRATSSRIGFAATSTSITWPSRMHSANHSRQGRRLGRLSLHRLSRRRHRARFRQARASRAGHLSRARTT